MNPRNLGRLKVSLSVTQDQTNVVLRTETGAAAQMLRKQKPPGQMLGEAGLKLASLTPLVEDRTVALASK